MSYIIINGRLNSRLHAGRAGRTTICQRLSRRHAYIIIISYVYIRVFETAFKWLYVNVVSGFDFEIRSARFRMPRTVQCQYVPTLIPLCTPCATVQAFSREGGGGGPIHCQSPFRPNNPNHPDDGAKFVNNLDRANVLCSQPWSVQRRFPRALRESYDRVPPDLPVFRIVSSTAVNDSSRDKHSWSGVNLDGARLNRFCWISYNRVLLF